MKLMKQRDLLLKQKRREKPMEAKELAKLAIQALEDKKAEDVKVIDISDVSTIADYFIIASGKNRSQIQAMCDNVEETLGRAGAAMKTDGRL